MFQFVLIEAFIKESFRNKTTTFGGLSLTLSPIDRELEFEIMWNQQILFSLSHLSVRSVTDYFTWRELRCKELKKIYDEHGDDWHTFCIPWFEIDPRTGELIETERCSILPGPGSLALAEAKSLGCSWTKNIEHPLYRLAKIQESKIKK